jgi:hypothetical protein
LVTQTTVTGAFDVILDATTAYFCAGPSVYKALKTGQPVQFVWEEPNAVALTALATDGTNLYAGTLKENIYRFTKSGGNSTLFRAPTSTSPSYITALAVGSYVYFGIGVGNSEVDMLDLAGNLVRSKTGGAQSMLADASDAYYAGWWGSDYGVISYSAGVDVRLPSQPLAIAMDANYFYWTDSGKVGRANRNGTGQVMLVSSNALDPERLTVDSTNVYFTDPTNHTISSVPIGGGSPVIIAAGQPHPISIAVDSVAVYWTNSTNGTLMKVAK